MTNNKSTVLKHGFTLAEVLITLVIIGVVAAMTIPTTISKYQEQERKTRIKKTYSTLSNAFMRSKADKGDFVLDNFDEDSIADWYNTYLKPYLITVKTCYNGAAGCWGGYTKFLRGGNCHYSDGRGIGSPRINAILSDGTYVNFDVYNGPDVLAKFKVQTDSFAVVVIFDINGEKEPNTFGKDTFAVIYTKNGFVPSYKDASSSDINYDCSDAGTGYSCIMKYL